MKKKTEKAKKYLCVVCGCIFIDTSPQTFVCSECKKVLRDLAERAFENETDDTPTFKEGTP